MLPLTFADKADYELVQPTDRVAITGLETFAPGVVRYLHHLPSPSSLLLLLNVSISKTSWPLTPALQPLKAVLTHADGSSDTIVLDHTFNSQQIDWFKHGSALNRMKAAAAAS